MNKNTSSLHDLSSGVSASATVLTVSDSSPQALGQLTHGLDEESAVKRLEAEQFRAAQDASTQKPTAFTYPFNVLDKSHEAIDAAFAEAFSAHLETGQNEIILQAQQTARECMADVLSGTAIMRLSPDQLRAIEQDIADVAEHVAREAVKLYGSKSKSAKSQHTPDIRRHIRDQLRAQKPVQDFKTNYLGFVAKVEQERAQSVSPDKQAQ